MGRGMTGTSFTSEGARAAGEQIGIDWATSAFDVEQFRMGMDVELEHGTQDHETNVTDDETSVTAKIARAPQRVPGLLLPPSRHGDRGRGVLGC